MADCSFFLNVRRIERLRRTRRFWRMSRSINVSFSLYECCLQSELELLKSVVDLDLFVTNTADLKFPKDEMWILTYLLQIPLI
jgi:hypothetical protein